MSLDNEIANAIREAVRAAGQGNAVAERLIAWFASLSEGNESLNDRERVLVHLELLHKDVIVDLDELATKE